MTTYQQKITFREMRESGVRDVLIHCRDHRCSHHVEVRRIGMIEKSWTGCGAVMKCAQSSLVLAALILGGPRMANAQEQIVRLQCNGAVDFYDTNPPVRDMSVKGIYLEIGKGSIKVAGSMGWDGEFEIKRTDPASVFFVSSRNAEYFGSVNKYSGEFQLNRAENQLRDGSKLLAAARGVCHPAKPLF